MWPSKSVYLMVIISSLMVCDGTAAYKILCVYPTIFRSHFIVAEALMKGLAVAGHNVTVASAFPPAKPIPNYRFLKIQLSDSHMEIMKRFTEADDFWSMIKIIPETLAYIEQQNRNLLKHEEFQKILETEQFDLVVYEGGMGELLIGLSAYFDCPTVLITSMKPQSMTLKFHGNPMSLAYVSSIVLGFSEPMDFLSRVGNMLFYFVEMAMMSYFEGKAIRFYEEQFPVPKYPPFMDIRRNVSAIFVSDHISQKSIRPLLPTFIQIGGIQINEVDLNDDLQQWMDKSTNGVIYFSLGSNMNSSDLKPEIVKEIFKVLGSRKENVLMKMDADDIVGLPGNIRIGKWLPQVGVLSHQYCKLFISHAGLGSLTEARHFGIPLITIPIFADQMPNSRIAVREGVAIEIKFQDLNGMTLSAALDEIIGNPKYSNEAKYQANLYLDRPQTALETGIFWIEYIIRHKGAPHMRSNGMHLNFWQYHSLDVITFLFLIVFLITYINWKILQFIICKIFGRKKLKTL